MSTEITHTLHLGSEGKTVSHAQWTLHQNRFGDSFLGPKHVDGKYGVVTCAAVREAKYKLGYPKHEINGSYGKRLDNYLRADGLHTKLPAKWARRRHARQLRDLLRSRTSTMLRVAESSVGYVEGANNHSKFGEWYNLDHNPWCAMFVSYCAWRAGLEFHYSYCPSVVADAKAKRNGLSVCRSQRGAAVLFDWQGDGVADHIGLVTRGGTRPATIEGNTSPSDFSNGGMVMRRVREPSQIQCYVKIGKARK